MSLNKKDIPDKETISVYGAGDYATRFLPKLMQQFHVAFVMDQSYEKQGTTIHGIKIVAPDEKNVNMYNVVVLLNNFNSGFESLKYYGCKKKVHGLVLYAGGYALFLHNNSEPMEFDLENVRYYENPNCDFGHITAVENKNAFKQNKNRVFNIACMDAFYATGGPCACLRNLWIANEEFQSIDNFYTICPSVCYVPRGAVVDDINSEKFFETPIDPEIFKDFPKVFSGKMMEPLYIYLLLKSTWKFFNRADARFHFTEKDVFLIQDQYALYVFVRRFPHLKKVIAAYHVQGALSSELKKKAPELIDTYDAWQQKLINCVKTWVFPSKGAMDGFLNTSTEKVKEGAKTANFCVAYNGYTPKTEIHPDEDFVKDLNAIKADVVFASATFLYRNKGVERIPKVLAEFKKKTGLKIRWILVGLGEMEKEVEYNIKKYLEEKDYTWYKKRFDNQDNIFALFKRADFYIMMHYVSVFDLSTLQAMGYGCIPILSNVGGNLELCGFDNGIIVNSDNNEISLEEYFLNGKWNNEYLTEKKTLNKKIIKDEFNDIKFLEGYKKVICKIDEV